VKETIEKSVKKRTKEECCSETYQLLKLAIKPLTTSDIAKKVNLSHRSTLNHLKFLEFDDKVKCFARGSWLYWKVIR
jgi:predicted ArsR family transcriptional regulator